MAKNLLIVLTKTKESDNLMMMNETMKEMTNTNMENNQLKFGNGNSKLKKGNKFIFGNFDLPSGYSCPMANECLAFANPETGKITDGKNTQFRCYAASIEGIYPAKRNLVWNNFKIVKELANKQGYKKLIEIIHDELPACHIFRIHTHGDFFNVWYFKAWMEVARLNPHIKFYFYTKRVDFISDYISEFPENFLYNISVGGKLDHMIQPWMKTAIVVYSEDEAKQKGLKIDDNDSLAYGQHKSFALLIHGTQPKGSEASKAWYKIKKKKTAEKKAVATAEKKLAAAIAKRDAAITKKEMKNIEKQAFNIIVDNIIEKSNDKKKAGKA
jgi:hypothetical protein